MDDNIFEIVSIGDGAFLFEVMKAVVMITGHADFGGMATLGLLLGGLLAFMKALFTGKSPEVHQFLASWLVFMFIFGSTAEVVIEDAYSGDVHGPFPGVPIGVAFAGEVVSSIGYSMTKVFEQGFTTVNATDSLTGGGFGKSVHTLRLITAHNLSEMASIGADLGSPYVSFRKSWLNYIAECTMVLVNMDPLAADRIARSSPFIDALRWDTVLRGTQIHTAPGGPQNLNCAEAHDQLKIFSEGTFYQAYLNGPMRDVLGELDGAAAELRIENAFESLGVDSTAKQFILTTLLYPLYMGGGAVRAMDDRAYAYATAYEDALRQRQVSYSAEAALFMRIVRPMMTFIEGFVFAITPLMGFIVTLGSFGISLAGKYLMLLLWIQLWMPVLAIVNLYLHMSVTRAFNSMFDPGGGATPAAAGIDSMLGYMSATDKAKDYLATAEMLAAAAPMLSLVLVSGSAVALTSLAKRLTDGSDYFDEKKVAPDSFQPAPGLIGGPSTTHSADEGYQTGGMFGSMDKISIGNMMEQSVAQSAMTEKKANAAWGESSSRIFKDGWNADHHRSVANSFTESRESTWSKGQKMAWEKAGGMIKGSAEQIGFSRQDVASFISQASLGAGIDVKGLRAALDASVQSNRSHSISDDQLQSFANTLNETYGKGTTEGTELNEAIKQDFAGKNGHAFSEAVEGGNAGELKKTAEASVSATNALTKAKTYSAQLGSSTEWNPGQVVARIRDADLVGRLNQAVQGPQRQAVEQMMSEHGMRFATALGPNGAPDMEAARIYVQSQTLYGNNPFDKSDKATTDKGRDALAGILTAASGRIVGHSALSDDISQPSAEGENPDATRKTVEANTRPIDWNKADAHKGEGKSNATVAPSRTVEQAQEEYEQRANNGETAGLVKEGNEERLAGLVKQGKAALGRAYTSVELPHNADRGDMVDKGLRATMTVANEDFQKAGNTINRMKPGSGALRRYKDEEGNMTASSTQNLRNEALLHYDEAKKRFPGIKDDVAMLYATTRAGFDHNIDGAEKDGSLPKDDPFIMTRDNAYESVLRSGGEHGVMNAGFAIVAARSGMDMHSDDFLNRSVTLSEAIDTAQQGRETNYDATREITELGKPWLGGSHFQGMPRAFLEPMPANPMDQSKNLSDLGWKGLGHARNAFTVAKPMDDANAEAVYKWAVENRPAAPGNVSSTATVPTGGRAPKDIDEAKSFLTSGLALNLANREGLPYQSSFEVPGQTPVIADMGSTVSGQGEGGQRQPDGAPSLSSQPAPVPGPAQDNVEAGQTVSGDNAAAGNQGGKDATKQPRAGETLEIRPSLPGPANGLDDKGVQPGLNSTREPAPDPVSRQPAGRLTPKVEHPALEKDHEVASPAGQNPPAEASLPEKPALKKVPDGRSSELQDLHLHLESPDGAAEVQQQNPLPNGATQITGR